MAMRILVSILVGLSVCGAIALADDDDHDRARHAVEAGRILPLKEILARAEADCPGRMIEAELEDEHGRLVYELKMLTADGRVMKLHYDAGTGELIGTRVRERRK